MIVLYEMRGGGEVGGGGGGKERCLSHICFTIRQNILPGACMGSPPNCMEYVELIVSNAMDIRGGAVSPASACGQRAHACTDTYVGSAELGACTWGLA